MATKVEAAKIQLTKDQKLLVYRYLAEAMALDRLMMRLIRTGSLVGFYHEGGISLAPGAAAGAFLRADDYMFPHYRAHGLAHMIGKKVDLASYIAEHMGREAGCCKGRSSFHWCFPEQGIYGLSGNIGANFSMCLGHAYAVKYQKGDQIVMNCSGDGSYGEGRAHEAMLMSALWQLPMIFWCENNGMTQHSAMDSIFPGKRIAPLAAGLGIPAFEVDGQDVFACAQAALTAIDHVRSGKGPIMVELLVRRAQEHSVGGVNYEGAIKREQSLMDEWKKNQDPLKNAAQRLIDEKVCTQAEIDAIAEQATKLADELEVRCQESPKATPPIEALLRDVYAA